LTKISLSGTKNEKWAKVVGLLIALFPPVMSISMSKIQYLPISIADCFRKKEENLPETDKIFYYLFQAGHFIYVLNFNPLFCTGPNNDIRGGKRRRHPFRPSSSYNCGPASP
jgi:hypothetical protein